MTMFEAERLSRMLAPASAPYVDGGFGDQKSSQISTWKVKSRTSLAVKTTRRRNTRPRRRGGSHLLRCRWRREIALLVEFAVVGQEAFGTTPSMRPRWMTTAQLKIAPRERSGAPTTRIGKRFSLSAMSLAIAISTASSRVLQQQIVDGVAGEREFGRQQDGGFLGVSFTPEFRIASALAAGSAGRQPARRRPRGRSRAVQVLNTRSPISGPAGGPSPSSGENVHGKPCDLPRI